VDRRARDRAHRLDRRLHSLRIEAAIEPFKAGQFTKLGLHIGDEIVGRPYSIVSAPGDPCSNSISRPCRKARSRRACPELEGRRQPSSWRRGRTASWSSTRCRRRSTSGCCRPAPASAPFLSILKTAEPWQRFQRVVLVHAARTADELTYRRAIARIMEAEPKRFSYIPVVSREGRLRARRPHPDRPSPTAAWKRAPASPWTAARATSCSAATRPCWRTPPRR
jgi:ferredoxin--NADP+ reductase